MQHEAYHHITEQLFDNAAFLWVLRNQGLAQPHYDAQDIAQLETRLQHNLDGLLLVSDAAWSLCEDALALGEPGETFVASVIAFASGHDERIQQVVETACRNPKIFGGLVSAMAWLPGSQIHSWLTRFFQSKDLDHKYLAVAVCSARRENPKDHLAKILDREDCREHEQLYMRSIRIIGELRRSDLREALTIGQSAKSESVCFWSHWSAVLVGDKTSIKKMEPYITTPGVFQRHAVQLVFRAAPLAYARLLLREMVKMPENNRQSIRAVEALGDVRAVPWLLQHMKNPELARLAGEAFSGITGLELEANNLTAGGDEERSNDSQHNADDTSEPITATEDEEDENLPWPDVQAIAAYWNSTKQRFADDQRYINGVVMSQEGLKTLLRCGKQRQRYYAALELSLHFNAPCLFNVDAKVC